jgi:hypothetical protein
MSKIFLRRSAFCRGTGTTGAALFFHPGIPGWLLRALADFSRFLGNPVR